MNSLKKKVGSTWAMVIVVCVTILAVSAVTATAATLINGKNIKKGTIAGT